jgi:uncharacterized protein
MFVTALYAGLLTPLFILLSVRVIRQRRSGKIGLGDGGSADMLRRMRVHANFAEYVPFALLLMALAESTQTSNWILHLAGAALVVGRIFHAYGVSRTPENFFFRVSGMAATFTVIGGLALACLYQSIVRLVGWN